MRCKAFPGNLGQSGEEEWKPCGWVAMASLLRAQHFRASFYLSLYQISPQIPSL